MTKLLFVGSENFHRSRACEEVFKSKLGFDARSAGTWDSARHRLEQGDMEWADHVFAMEKSQEHDIRRSSPSGRAGNQSQD